MIDTQDFVNKVVQYGDAAARKAIRYGVHKLRALTTPTLWGKDLTSIDYKNELDNYTRLKPKYFFSNDGLLEKTEYYFEDELILEVSESYEYVEGDEIDNSLMISERGIASRVKTWNYYLSDGTIDQSNYKVKEKFYDTLPQRIDVGKRRRTNIQLALSERAGTALIILGLFATSKLANDEMKSISTAYSNEFSEYDKYGTQEIINSINADVSILWFDTSIPTNNDIADLLSNNVITQQQHDNMVGAFALYDLSSLQGLTFREYFIQKLKGEIK